MTFFIHNVLRILFPDNINQKPRQKQWLVSECIWADLTDRAACVLLSIQSMSTPQRLIADGCMAASSRQRICNGLAFVRPSVCLSHDYKNYSHGKIGGLSITRS